MFKARIKLIVMLMIMVGTCCCLTILPTYGAATAIAATSMPAETTPVSSLESPSEGAATSSSSDTEVSASNDQDGGEDICLRCYDKVKMAQDMIAIHTSLLEKQKKLIHRKNKAAAAAASASASASASPARASGSINDGDEIGRNAANTRSRLNNRKFNNENNQYENNSNQQHQQQGTVRSRTLQTSEPIVISRLRVARAAASILSSSTSSSSSPSSSNNNNNNGKLNNLNKKEPDLKRLKQEQQQQLNATCKSLLLVQECLSELERECIGNLQFHSLEVYSNQWHSKLICPYRNNPNLKVFPGLRSIHEDIEQPKVPIPRRISSDEEVRSRLHEMFPNGFARPFGVMLKPTLTTTASQRFGQLLQAQQLQQQQQQQQQEGNKQQQLRDFTGHFNHQHQHHHLQNHNHQLLNQPNHFERVVDDFHIGRILLVPCCFAIMVAVVALASLYHWRPFDEKA